MIPNTLPILAFAIFAVANAQVTTITPQPTTTPEPEEPCSSTTICTDIIKDCTTAELTYGGYF